MSKIIFALENPVFSDDWATLTGKVFEVGDYPDKDFAITDEEMDGAISAFKPVDANLEHSQIFDVLGNGLGGLQRLWRSGKDVLGEITVPKWLSDLAGGKIQTSLEFDGSKNVTGIGYTLNPRITDAQVVAAFSTFAGQRHSAKDIKDLQTIHDLAVSQGAACSSTAMSQTPAGRAGSPGGHLMSKTIKERVLAWFQNSPPKDITEDELKSVFTDTSLSATTGLVAEAAKPAEAKTAEDPAATAAFKAELASLSADRDAMVSTFAEGAATKFVDDALKAKKAVPAQTDKLKAAFVAALKADGGGKITFTAGALTEGEAVKALRELIEATPAHLFTSSTMGETKGGIFDPNAAGKDALTPEKITELRRFTSVGQAKNAKEAARG